MVQPVNSVNSQKQWYSQEFEELFQPRGNIQTLAQNAATCYFIIKQNKEKGMTHLYNSRRGKSYIVDDESMAIVGRVSNITHIHSFTRPKSQHERFYLGIRVVGGNYSPPDGRYRRSQTSMKPMVPPTGPRPPKNMMKGKNSAATGENPHFPSLDKYTYKQEQKDNVSDPYKQRFMYGKRHLK